jgi:hypothetical protein
MQTARQEQWTDVLPVVLCNFRATVVVQLRVRVAMRP